MIITVLEKQTNRQTNKKLHRSPFFEEQYSLSLPLCLCSHHVKSCYIFALQISARE